MKIWILSDFDKNKYQAFKNLLLKFSKENPEIKVEFEIKNKETLWESFFSFLRSPSKNPLPEIVEIPHSWTDIFSKLGLFLEIPGIIKDFKVENYPDFLKKGFMDENLKYVFSVPFWLEIYTLQYRKDMIDKLKIKKNMDFLSWEDFISICEELKKKNKKKDFYPLDNFSISGTCEPDEILSCVLNRGANGYFSLDNGYFELLREDVLKGIEDFFHLFEKEYISVLQENPNEANFIKSSLSAMAFSWRKPLKIGKNTLETLQFPQIRRKENVSRSFNLAITSSTTEIEESLNVLSWLIKEENVSYFTKSFSVFSPYKKSLEVDFKEESLKTYSNLYPSLTLTPNFMVYPTFEKVFSKLILDSVLEILRKDFQKEVFRRKLIGIKGEIDYLLSIY